MLISFEDLDGQLTELESQEKHLAKLTRQPVLRWNGVDGVSRALGFILHGERTIARFANDSRKATKAETELVQQIRNHIADCGEFRRRWADSRHRLTIYSALPSSLPIAELGGLHKRRERLRKIVQSFADLAEQYRTAFTNTLPEYASIKRNMPVGGRDVYSMILAFARGTEDDNLPDYQEWFGFSSPKFGDIKRQPKLRARREKSGKAPSVKRGRELVNQLSRDIRLPALSREDRVRRLKVDNADGFNLHNACPSVRKASYAPECRKWKAMSLRVMGIAEAEYRNRLPTVLTGRPERLTGDDYYAPCVANVEIMGPAKAGFILMRSGWNDVIHVQSVDNVADCQEKLDNASRYYFEQLRGKQNRRKALAELVRSCRRIPCFTLADSYAAGNCQPGTRQFVTQLGLPKVDAIPGNRLASYWRRAGYPQLERFAGVVQRLASHQPNWQSVDTSVE